MKVLRKQIHNGFSIEPILFRFLSLFVITVFIAIISACGDGDGAITPPSEDEPEPPEFFDPTDFPIPVQDAQAAWGQAAFDESGDLLVVGGRSGSIFKVSRYDESQTEVLPVSGTSGHIVSVVVDINSRKLYVGDQDGSVYLVDRVTGYATPFGNVGFLNSVNGLVIAPDDYGDFGGHIIAATDTGIFALDPAEEPGAPAKTIVDGRLSFSDLEFAEDGTLYAVRPQADSVYTIEPDGVYNPEIPLRGLLSGIAVDNTGQRLFVAKDLDNELYSVDIETGSFESLGYNFDFYNYPSGLAFDGQNLLMLTGGDYSMQIELITP